MASMMQPRRITGQQGMDIALAWQVLTTGDREIIWHNGITAGYRSFVGFDPRARTGVVILGNANTTAGIDDIGRHLLEPGFAVKVARIPSATEAAARTGYAGRYQLTPQVVMTVQNTGGRLFAQLTGQPRFELIPESPTVFVIPSVAARLTFEPALSGGAAAVVLRQNGVDIRAPRIE
jgi:hypothetical protein